MINNNMQSLSVSTRPPVLDPTTRIVPAHMADLDAMEAGLPPSDACALGGASKTWGGRAGRAVTPYLPGRLIASGLQKTGVTSTVRSGLEKAGLVAGPVETGAVAEGCGGGAAAGCGLGLLAGFGAGVPMVVIGILKCLNVKTGVNSAGHQDLNTGIPLIVVGAFMPEITGIVCAILGSVCGASCGACCD